MQDNELFHGAHQDRNLNFNKEIFYLKSAVFHKIKMVYLKTNFQCISFNKIFFSRKIFPIELVWRAQSRLDSNIRTSGLRVQADQKTSCVLETQLMFSTFIESQYLSE